METKKKKINIKNFFLISKIKKKLLKLKESKKMIFRRNIFYYLIENTFFLRKEIFAK